MASIGEIHTAKIYYKGTSGPYKVRPVIIVNEDSGSYTAAEITSVRPKNPPGFFDECKQEIKEWQQAGLDDPSWVKCHLNNLTFKEDYWNCQC